MTVFWGGRRPPWNKKGVIKWTPEKKKKCSHVCPGNHTPKTSSHHALLKVCFRNLTKKDSFNSPLYLIGIEKKKTTPSWVRCSFNQTQIVCFFFLESYYIWNVALTNVKYMSDVKAVKLSDFFVCVCRKMASKENLNRAALVSHRAFTPRLFTDGIGHWSEWKYSF